MVKEIISLEELFASVLDVPLSSLTDQSEQRAIQNWTSMAHINLMLAIEETYGVTFTTEEMLGAKSIGAARRLLNEKGVAV